MRLRSVFGAFVLAAVSAFCGEARAEAPPDSSVTPEAVSENHVFDLWLRQSSEVRALKSKISEARFDVVTAGLWQNPTLGINGSFVLSGTPPDGKVNYGPQLSLPLPIFGQISARKSEASAALSVAEVDVQEQLWERAADLQNAMLDRAFADARVEQLQQNLKELARVGQVVQNRAAAGANPRYDILRAGTTEATFRAALADAEMDRARAETRLVSLVAVPGVISLPVTRTSLTPFRGPETEEGLVSAALTHRPDLELAVRDVSAAEASASRYRKENVPIPTIGVGPYFTHQEQSVSLQATLSLPLPVFDRNQGFIGRSLARADGDRAMAQAIRQRIRVEVIAASRAREEAKRVLTEFQQGGLTTIDELLRRAEVSYQAGTFSILDLLDAYRAVWEARSQALELEKNLAEADADLEHATALLPGGA